MDGVRSRREGRLHNVSDVEVSVEEPDGLVGLTDVWSVSVRIDVHGDAADPKLVGRAENTPGNFPAGSRPEGNGSQPEDPITLRTYNRRLPDHRQA